MKMTFNLVVDTTTGTFEITNTETGETKSVKTKKTSKKTKDENHNPQIILEDNKYKFNSAAVKLMNISPEDRVDIKYEKENKKFIPIIGKDSAFGTANGNRVTKTLTVSYRGKANEELRQYGTIFEVKPHPTKEGLFKLIGDAPELPTSEDVDLPDDDPEVDLVDDDINLEDLVDDADDLTSNDFSF